ncbi:hypothetical protein MTO96_026158 [Rhipicephalus appendiculatus]
MRLPHRPVMVFLASAAAAVGAFALVVLLVRKMRVLIAGEVLLTEERASYTVRLKERFSVTHNVRLFRFALKSPQQKLGFRVGEHVLLFARIGDRTVMRPVHALSAASTVAAASTSWSRSTRRACPGSTPTVAS